MTDSGGPLIVRYPPPDDQPTTAGHRAKPGLHSHNRTRPRPAAIPAETGSLLRLRTWLLILGICGLGYYGYSVADQSIYQAYQNWAFDRQIAGRKVSFSDYVREKTPFGFLVGAGSMPSAPPPTLLSQGSLLGRQGFLLGRLKISRLNLSAMVREGVDDKTLSVAVGHVPSTALPGQTGNFAIAAHRDTLFRALKDIRKDDLVTFQSTTGTYTYQVRATQIVKPTEIRVLQPDGGGLIAPSANSRKPDKLLTMITCYPFYYVGSAPKRFIVEAKLVASDTADRLPPSEAQNTGPPTLPGKPKAVRHILAKGPRHARTSFRVNNSTTKQPPASRPAPQKRGFWHKLLHLKT